MTKLYEQLSGTPYKMIMTAGQVLGYPEWLFKNALARRENHEGLLHITRDSDKRELTYPSLRVVVNFFREFLPSQGGIKISPDIFGGYTNGEHSYINPYKLWGLGIEMAVKHLILGTHNAGAKAAIEVPTNDILTYVATPEYPCLIDILLKKWGRDIGSQILHPLVGGVGPDSQTGNKMHFIYEGLTSKNFSPQEAAGCVTAKPIKLGGIEIRDKSTGIGVAFAVMDQINILLEQGRIKNIIENVRIVFQGAGAVGRSAMEYLIEKKYKIIAFSSLSDQIVADNSVSLYCEDGFTIEQLNTIINDKGQIVVEKVKLDKSITLTYSGEAIFDIEAEIFVPAAKERVVTIQHVFTRLMQSVVGISEAANMPLTEEAYNIIDKKRILYFIGPSVNSLGVGASTLERRNALLGQRTTYDEQFRGLQQFWENIRAFRNEALLTFPCETGDLTTSIYYLVAHHIGVQRTRNIIASTHKVK